MALWKDVPLDAIDRDYISEWVANLRNTGLPLDEGIVLYSLRHTAATWMLEGGASLYEVSKSWGTAILT